MGFQGTKIMSCSLILLSNTFIKRFTILSMYAINTIEIKVSLDSLDVTKIEYETGNAILDNENV